MAKKCPDRIRYQREHYACFDLDCKAAHDAEYIRTDLHEAALTTARKDAREAEWQPIETAPKDGTAILVYGPELLREHTGHCMVVRWQTTEFSTVPWWTISDGKFGPYDLRGPSPTHWMPLPDIPIEAAASDEEGGGDG